ncbi:DUF4166 domain-containing protein [Yinghuangia seranimata]|uniref:DUF4166 domain-containing protein n=1 Tax=Yinghuangia seranimata TaxID=408067 RepID=UPI00248BEBA9|nr:DUF4166 domain-containing protein [Yinghuangia seranimata]MDI2126478.1 DUF4166 domain-containing protein [Yinghuangia seranimata]
MGRDFGRLHPELRRRFGVGLDAGEACVGTGTMRRIWNGTRLSRPLLRPFLAVGDRRHILLAETGEDVPFTIENYPYLDSYGRETVTFVRTFDLPRRRRRFDATMVYSERRDCVVDYLGTHQHLAVDLAFAADRTGGLVIRSGGYRFRERALDTRLPRAVVGDAVVRERFDDATGRFHISVRVTNPVLGPLFGYDGAFTAAYADLTAHSVPASVRPVREEARC